MKMDVIAAGCAGGLVGAAVVGLVARHWWQNMGSFLPIVVEFHVDADGVKSKFYTHGYITHKPGACHAKLTLHPFKLAAGTTTIAAISSPLFGGWFPVALTPVKESVQVPTKMYVKTEDNKVNGFIQINKNFTITLASEAPAAQNELWGLAEEVCVHFPVAV